MRRRVTSRVGHGPNSGKKTFTEPSYARQPFSISLDLDERSTAGHLGVGMVFDQQPDNETSHLSLLPEHGTDEFDDGTFEQAIREARRRELVELEQLNG